MTSEDPKHIPERLTPQQWRVLLLICEGKTNREIASELSIEHQSARNYVTAINGKLGFKNYREGARGTELHKAYCGEDNREKRDEIAPIGAEIERDQLEFVPEDNRPMDEEDEQDEVDEHDLTLTSQDTPSSQRRSPVWWLRVLVILVASVALILACGLIFSEFIPLTFFGDRDESPEALSSPESEATPSQVGTSVSDIESELVATITAQAQEKEMLEASLEASTPVQTPTEPSTQAPPTTPAFEATAASALATVTSTPDSLLFFDNFNGEPRGEWSLELANWTSVGEKFTIRDIDPSVADGTEGFALVGDSNWQNYRLEVEIDLGNTANVNKAAVLVHVQDIRNYLVLLFNDLNTYNFSRDDAAWFIVEDGEARELSRTSTTEYPKDRAFIVTIEVRGNEIDSFVDGVKFMPLRDPDPPFWAGKIGLYIQSSSIQNAATFDDFVVKSLPP